MRALVFVAVVGCGSVKNSTDGGIDGSLTPPTILDVSPSNMATGVLPDAKVVVKFSKAMDQTATQTAWSSADLLPGDVTFSWNAAGDTLTVTANQGLPVAEGTGLDPSTVTARRVTYSIGTGATDTGGRALAAPLAIEFTTVRRLSFDVAEIDALTQSVFNDGTVVNPPSGAVGASDFTNVFSRVFVSFQLPALPTGATLTAAVMSGTQESVSGAAYATLGAVKAQHVTFTALNATTFNAAPLFDIGDYSTTPTLEVKSIEVTDRVKDDYANSIARSGRSQYRLLFAVGTNNDSVKHFAFFTRTAFTLKLTYIVE
jgi:Bacterial Ig-like domain